MDSLYESLRWRYPSFTRGLSGQSSLLRIISSFKNEARKIDLLYTYTATGFSSNNNLRSKNKNFSNSGIIKFNNLLE